MQILIDFSHLYDLLGKGFFPEKSDVAVDNDAASLSKVDPPRAVSLYFLNLRVTLPLCSLSY